MTDETNKLEKSSSTSNSNTITSNHDMHEKYQNNREMKRQAFKMLTKVRRQLSYLTSKLTGMDYNQAKALFPEITSATTTLEIAKQISSFSVFMLVFYIIGYLRLSCLWIGILSGVLIFKEKTFRMRQEKIDTNKKIHDSAELGKEELMTKNLKRNRRNSSIILNESLSQQDFFITSVTELSKVIEHGSMNQQWMNDLLTKIWPYLTSHIRNTLETSVEPMVNQMEPKSILSSFKFDQIYMGSIPIKIASIESKNLKEYDAAKNAKTRRSNSVVLDMEIDFCSDTNISFSCMMMSLGIEDVIFKGNCRVELTPLIPVPPFFGSLAISFTSKPEIDFNLTGVGNICEIPGLNAVLHDTVDNIFASMFVLPKKMVIPMITADIMELQDLKQMDIMHPFPEGLVFLHLRKAHNLIAKDNLKALGVKLKKGSSDPFVELKLGSITKKSKTIYKNLNPVFDEKYMLLCNNPKLQKIDFEVWDYDDDMLTSNIISNAPDKLGTLHLNICDIYPTKSVGNSYALSGVESGLLDVDCFYTELVETFDKVENRKSHPGNKQYGCHATVCSLVVETVSGVPKRVQQKFPTTYLELIVQNENTYFKDNGTTEVNEIIEEVIGVSHACPTTDEIYFDFQFFVIQKNEKLSAMKLNLRNSTDHELLATHAIDILDTEELDLKISEYYDNMQFTYQNERLQKFEAFTCRYGVRIRRAVGEVSYRSIKENNDSNEAYVNSRKLSFADHNLVDVEDNKKLRKSKKKYNFSAVPKSLTESKLLQNLSNSRTSETAGDFTNACLSVKILNAKNLLAMDSINLGYKKIQGKSDPYVKIKFGQQKFKTSIIEKDLNPVWNEHHSFPIPDPCPETLSLELFDYDVIGADDKLGFVEIDLTKVLSNRNQVQRFVDHPLDTQGNISFNVMYLEEGNTPTSSESKIKGAVQTETKIVDDKDQTVGDVQNKIDVADIKNSSAGQQQQQQQQNISEKCEEQTKDQSKKDSNTSKPRVIVEKTSPDLVKTEQTKINRTSSALSNSKGRESISQGLSSNRSTNLGISCSTLNSSMHSIQTIDINENSKSQSTTVGEDYQDKSQQYNLKNININTDTNETDSGKDNTNDNSELSLQTHENINRSIMQKTYKVQLNLKFTDDGILQCEVLNVYVPDQSSYKENRPGKNFYLQINLLKENRGNSKKALGLSQLSLNSSRSGSKNKSNKVSYQKFDKRKTQVRPHIEDLINFDEKIELRCPANYFNYLSRNDQFSSANSPSISSIYTESSAITAENGNIWLHISLKTKGKGIMASDKTIRQGKISMQLIFDRALEQNYSAWFPLY